MKFLFFILCFCCFKMSAQQPSKVWVADLGNGMYRNPVLHADYSDPDAIRVGEEFYMTASSFEDVPGLPILRSRDLVNWQLVAHALPQLIPSEHFSVPRHGEGVWAPSIRFRNGEFLIYYGDPDFGIYRVSAKDPRGPWSTPVLIEAGKGLIDPCPFWDDDGKAYLVHAFAGSRAGIKSLLVVKPMNDSGTKTAGDGVIVYDGHKNDPTVEGPKFYKRNGYYYIFAPAGGVATGWQLVLRSKNILGPYERKVVMDQGSTSINGPHQGAWVNTLKGEDWFLHFQDKGAYGRIVHLQPLKWINDWPVIGEDKDGDGKGEPVTIYKKPSGLSSQVITPPESDEFNEPVPGLQWQWMSNPRPYWRFMNVSAGMLSLFSDTASRRGGNLWERGNILLQKFPAPAFVATTKMEFHPNSKLLNEKAGLTIMGLNYAGLALKSTSEGIALVYFSCMDADKGTMESETVVLDSAPSLIYLRVTVTDSGRLQFGYSTDGRNFKEAGGVFTAREGKWKGARLGIFCSREQTTNDAGYANFDWFRIESATGKQ